MSPDPRGVVPTTRSVCFSAAMSRRFAPAVGAPAGLSARAVVVLGLAVVAIAAWLTEPRHGVPSALVAFALAAAIFALRVPGTDFLAVGGLVMIAGCVLLVLVGRHLQWFLPPP